MQVEEAGNAERKMALNRRDWALLLLALREAADPLDPVRIQSGMFMASRDLPPGHQYEFEAAEMGPFSSRLDSDVEQLEEEGLLVHHGVGNYTWSEFVASAAGMGRAEELMNRMSEDELRALRILAHLKQNVLRLGFRELMEHLSRNYPAPEKRAVLQ